MNITPYTVTVSRTPSGASSGQFIPWSTLPYAGSSFQPLATLPQQQLSHPPAFQWHPPGNTLGHQHLNTFNPQAKPTSNHVISRTAVSRPSFSPTLSGRLLRGVSAVGLLGAAAFVAHKKTGFQSSFKAISSNIQPWLATFLGVAAVNQANKALNLQLSPTARGLELVGVMSPLMLGLRLPALTNFLITAPLVAGVIQLNQWLSEKAGHGLKERYGVPEPVTRLGLMLTSMALSVLALSPLMRAAKSVLPNTWTQLPPGAGTSVIAGAEAACARGCCVGTSGLCITEVAEVGSSLGGGLLSGFTSHFNSVIQQAKTLCKPLGLLLKGH